MSQPNTFGIPQDSAGWKAFRKEKEEEAKQFPEAFEGDDWKSINKPSHYNRKNVEAIKAIEASMSEIEFLGYLKGNVEKYLWRYAYKNTPSQDLKKAQWYLSKMIVTCADIGDEKLKLIFNEISD